MFPGMIGRRVSDVLGVPIVCPPPSPVSVVKTMYIEMTEYSYISHREGNIAR